MPTPTTYDKDGAAVRVNKTQITADKNLTQTKFKLTTSARKKKKKRDIIKHSSQILILIL